MAGADLIPIDLKTATPARQIVLAGVAALAVLLVVGGIWLLFLRPSYQPLFTGLRAADAGTIAAELDRQKIPYRIADGGATIMVAEDRIDRTRLSVMNEDLPLKGAVGFELFNNSDMGLTDFAQKINYQRALQGELVRTILTIDGVENARVHLSLGEDRIFRDDRVPPKASVSLHMREGRRLRPGSAEGIQRLIAAAVPQLDPNDVVIVDAMGRTISGALSLPSDIALSPPMQERKAIADYYAARIRNVMAERLGIVEIPLAVDLALVGDDAAVLGGWTPEARSFGLRVLIDPTHARQRRTSEEIRGAVADAIGLDAALGDMIAFGPVPQPPLTRLAPAPVDWEQPAARPAAGEPLIQSPSGGGWATALCVLPVAAGFMLLLWRRTTRRLTDEDRRAFAARLRQALDRDAGETAHGA